MNAQLTPSTMESLVYAAGITAYADDCDRIVHRPRLEEGLRAASDSDALPPTPYGE